ncbi:hypothetical protein H4R27_003760 [Coemansia aciculifera]|nr:hypothetical protein H4R27_003760 [Coemansia aciculifera]
MSSFIDPRNFYHDQRGLGPGSAVEPTASEVKQGYTAQAKNPVPLPKLFQPLKIRGLTLKNRVAANGFATDFHLVHIGQLAMRGLDLTIMEASGVSTEGRITLHCLGIWKDEHIEKLQQILMKVHGRNAEVSTGGWSDNVLGPSAIAFGDNSWMPKELSIDDIHRIQQDFALAAIRADKAGFDVTELHSAHGYLLHEFLSPISNKRTDEYGGTFDNRIRFVVKTVRKVRQVWPEQKPLFVRLSMTDWVSPSDDISTGVWTEEESVELVKILAKEGVDLVDCSTSGSSPKQQIPLSPGYQVRFATAIKQAAPNILAGAVGLITNAKQANDIVEDEKAGLVFFARALLRDLNFVLNGAAELGVFAQYPHQYERGRNKSILTFV